MLLGLLWKQLKSFVFFFVLTVATYNAGLQFYNILSSKSCSSNVYVTTFLSSANHEPNLTPAPPLKLFPLMKHKRER